MEESHDLDAYRCSECLRPLGPRESVTVGWQQLPWWGVCLSGGLITRNRRCQLDDPLYSIHHPLRLRGLAYLAVDESNQLVGGEGLRG
jgi:hypothetical protein